MAGMNELLALAADRSPPARARLATAIGDLAVQAAHSSHAAELALAADILRKLIRDVEIPVRRTLAARLAREPRVPHDLIVDLAHDAIEVAEPSLRDSTVLNDADLLDVVRRCERQHRMAVARRQAVSETVSAALVDAGEREVMTTLLANRGAKLSPPTFDLLI